MVESYSKNANHNMRRPVVKDEIVDFMRKRQKPVAGALKEYSHHSAGDGRLLSITSAKLTTKENP